MAGTTVVGAMFTFSGVSKTQGSIVGMCIKVFGFLGLGIKKGCFLGSFLRFFAGFWGVIGGMRSRVLL